MAGTAGALELVALDGQRSAKEVMYTYLISNDGSDVITDILVTDDQFGTIGTVPLLDPTDSTTLTAMSFISETTTNLATATGSGTGACVAEAEATVTVLPPPPCNIGVTLDKVEDDKLKIKLTNNDSRNRTVTMDSLTVSYPTARGIIEKVKLDGDAYKYGDSDAPIVGNPASFGPDDWTADDVSKRQIKPGDTKTLEIETFDKSSKDGRFEVTVDFGDGCTLFIVVENQQISNLIL